ncbi:MAG: nitroreductase family protein [Bacteroidota bacterium]
MTKDLVEAIEQRRSVREFKPDPVPDATISRIVGLGLMAPTAGNVQPWRFWVVKRAEIKAALARAAFGQKFVEEAAVVVVVAAEPDRSAAQYGKRGSELYCVQDTAAAVENILLSVVAYGLGACWVGAFDEDTARRALGMPEDVRPVAMVPIGYPKRDPAGKRPRPQRPWEEVVTVVE